MKKVEVNDHHSYQNDYLEFLSSTMKKKVQFLRQSNDFIH